VPVYTLVKLIVVLALFVVLRQFWKGIRKDISPAKIPLGNSQRYSWGSSSSSSSLKFLEWPKQQCHHKDHYRQSKYEQYQTLGITGELGLTGVEK